jgi:hypothetical protein
VTGALRAGGKILRGVVASRGSRLASAGPCETRRTPGSAAGCNKPASPCAEKPGEVVRNHAVGTGLRDWHPEAEGDELAHGREWTRIGPSQEGAKLTEGRWGQAFGATRATGPTPGEEAGVSRSGQQAGLRRGAEEWVDDPLAAMLVDRRRVAECLEGPLLAGASRVHSKAREDAGKANRPAT